MKDRNPILDIAEDSLDQEWVEQPRLIFQHSQEEADACRDFSVAKAALELIEAELYLDVRLSPSEYGLPEKPSETTIHSAIVTNQKYQTAQEGMIEAKHRLDLHGAHMDTLREKGKALENLVKLHLTGFHSEPRADTEVSREYAGNAQKNSARKPVKRS